MQDFDHQQYQFHPHSRWIMRLFDPSCDLEERVASCHRVFLEEYGWVTGTFSSAT